MLTSEQIRALSLDEIVIILNEYVTDPYGGFFPYIRENDETFLDEIGEKFGGWWVACGIANGHFNETDKYAICIEDGNEIRTFSTKEEIFDNIISPEDISESYNLAVDCENYKKSRENKGADL